MYVFNSNEVRIYKSRGFMAYQLYDKLYKMWQEEESKTSILDHQVIPPYTRSAFLDSKTYPKTLILEVQSKVGQICWICLIPLVLFQVCNFIKQNVLW